MEEIKIKITYTKEKTDVEMEMLKNEENKVKNIIEEIDVLKVQLSFMKRYKALNTLLDKLFLIYK